MTAAEASPIRVLVWGENRHEQIEEHVAKIYPQGMHATIAEGIAQRIQGRVLQSESKEFLGNPGFEATLSHGPRNRLRVVGFSRRGHRYLLTGTAPAGDPAVQQFLDSFDLNP